MDVQEIDAVLRATLDDRRVSRSERRALSEVFASLADRPEIFPLIRHRAFELARESVDHPKDKEVVAWLEDLVKVVDAAAFAGTEHATSEARFSEVDDCSARIEALIGQCHKTLDVCVFTITDDRITRAILAAHKRGVVVRIVTDDEKAGEPGSDVALFQQLGIAVRMDRTTHHMHHKFALFDSARLLTGSYNWTRGAAQFNEENFLVTTEAGLLAAYQKAFARLWERYA